MGVQAPQRLARRQVCDLCRMAVREMRKRILREVQKETEALLGGTPMTYHQGTTATGKLIHAVPYENHNYGPRTICGSRVKSAKRRVFGQDPEACTRCVKKLFG